MGHRQDCSSSLREELEQAQERASEPPIHEIRPKRYENDGGNDVKYHEIP